MAITVAQKKFGNQIQRIRKSIGISQEKLAEQVKVSRAHMGHIEQGRKSPSLELLRKIAKVLKVNEKDFF